MLIAIGQVSFSVPSHTHVEVHAAKRFMVTFPLPRHRVVLCAMLHRACSTFQGARFVCSTSLIKWQDRLRMFLNTCFNTCMRGCMLRSSAWSHSQSFLVYGPHATNIGARIGFDVRCAASLLGLESTYRLSTSHNTCFHTCMLKFVMRDGAL